MKVSKYVKVDVNILLEYIYDDSNLLGESYQVGVNIKNNNTNFFSSESSSTINTLLNSLFPIDLVNNRYGKFDTSNYAFLQTKDFSGGFPIRYDKIKIHLPINYTFGENIGFYIRAYAFDSQNVNTHDLTNFYYDITNISQDILEYNNPPLFFQEKLWGKSITIDIPSLYTISNQRVNNGVKDNTINYNLTNGVGLDQNTPLFIDFQFIYKKDISNSIETYLLSTKKTISLPQSPEFENVGVKIEESVNGDFFEIYGVYNDNIGDFNSFIKNAIYSGNRYHVEYNITMYEQNIRGKSMKIVLTDDFLSKVEYRPIIKYSTTTAIIDIEMNLIDSNDYSQITRRCSYGMLQDQVSKYSLKLLKINLSNAHKPKIYNQKSISNNISNQNSNLVLETIKVSYPVLIDKYNIVAKSDNAILNKSVFFGIGKIMIVLYPFDNIIKFIIASQISDNKVNYMDLTNMGEIKLVIKNNSNIVEMPLYSESDEVNLLNGFVVFKLVSNKINDLRRIYSSGINVFYITSTNQNTTTVVYSGLYKIYDSVDNVNSLNQSAAIEEPISPDIQKIIPDDVPLTGTAIVTRKIITTSGTASQIN